MSHEMQAEMEHMNIQNHVEDDKTSASYSQDGDNNWHSCNFLFIQHYKILGGRLQALSSLGKKTPMSFDWRLIERIDPQTRIVHHRIIPSSGFSSKVQSARQFPSCP